MSTFKENALRVIAVIGLIAILLLGAWGIIQLAFMIPGFFSGEHTDNTPAAAAETISLSVPQSVTSGAALPVSWSHKNSSGSYSYALSYACADGLSVKAPLPTGAYQSVPCNTAFNYTNATKDMGIVASVSGTKAATLNLTVSATKLSSGQVTASAAGRVAVTAVKTATAPAKTTVSKSTGTGSTYVAAPRTQNLYGYADLGVTITSNFSGGVRAGSRVALQFVITNTGTNVAQSGWSFSATLPYNPVYTFNSGAQQALYPGDKILYTLSYDAQYSGPQYTQGSGCDGWTFPCTPNMAVSGGPGTCNSYGPCNVPGYTNNVYGYYNSGYNIQSASIQVDPYNLVWELSEANNQAGVTYTLY